MGDAAKFANMFSQVLTEVASTVTEEKRSLEEQIESLRAQQKQIDTEIAELERGLGSIDKEIALGLTHAAREAGVRVVLADGTKESGKPAAGSAAADSLEKYLDQMLNVIPDGEEKALTIGKVTKSVDIEDPTIVARCVRKLLKTGKITSVGERRAKRYFRPAKQLAQVKK